MTSMSVTSIGDHKVQLLTLKIKDNADHVGLSQQPDLLKVLANSPGEDFNHFLNHN
jgi:hypothetical protein